MDEFERECKVMELYTENAKTYVQLSVGALVLSITFLHEVLGIPKEQRVQTDWWLILSWVSLLVTVITGAFYQYLAVKFLEWKSGLPRTHRNWFSGLIHHPWSVYGAMLISFYLGAILFLVAAIRRLVS